MFTAGVVFAVLAGLQVFFIVMRAVSRHAARRLLVFSENHPTLKYDMAEKNAELRSKLETMEGLSMTGPKVFALIFLAISLAFFYFQ